MQKYKVVYSVKGQHTYDRARHGSADFETVESERQGTFYVMCYGKYGEVPLEEFIDNRIHTRERWHFDDWNKVTIEKNITKITFEVVNE